MKEVKLLISVMRLIVLKILIIISIKFVRNDFTISFNNEPDNFKESKFLSLFFSQVLTVELNKLKKDGFEEKLSLLNSLIDIHERHYTVKDESGGNDIVPKID